MCTNVLQITLIKIDRFDICFITRRMIYSSTSEKKISFCIIWETKCLRLALEKQMWRNYKTAGGKIKFELGDNKTFNGFESGNFS